jgi:hypothetical protein
MLNYGSVRVVEHTCSRVINNDVEMTIGEEEE